MANHRKCTREELVEAIKTSRSIRQALKKVGLAPAGGNYMTAHILIEEEAIDVSHMTGPGWSRGITTGRSPENKIPLSEILIVNSYYASSRLKGRLLREGLKADICERCGLSEWNGEPIPLELDHINGNSFDNRLENLRVLCPNCHSQTPHFRGKNIGNQAYQH
jgi:hypothetical protein